MVHENAPVRERPSNLTDAEWTAISLLLLKAPDGLRGRLREHSRHFSRHTIPKEYRSDDFNDSQDRIESFSSSIDDRNLACFSSAASRPRFSVLSGD